MPSAFAHASSIAFEPVAAVVEHSLHRKVVVSRRGFDAIEFEVCAEQVVRQPRHGGTTDAVSAMAFGDTHVEQRAADVEVAEIECPDQTDVRVAGSSRPHSRDPSCADDDL